MIDAIEQTARKLAASYLLAWDDLSEGSREAFIHKAKIDVRKKRALEPKSPENFRRVVDGLSQAIVVAERERLT
jgi:hypothetical protein